VLEISEQERGRIGRDLHDGVCQLLVNLSYDLHHLRQNLEARHLPESAQAERLELRLRETMRQARHVAHDLCPVVLPATELAAALSALALATTEDFGIHCTAECEPTAPLVDDDTATQLYRIAQEAVHNAVKHAAPRRIAIRLATTADGVRLEVSNDGRDFPRPATAGTGLGLQIMAYRAGLLGGHFELRRLPGGGTIAACNIPLHGTKRRPARSAYVATLLTTKIPPDNGWLQQTFNQT
jgi:signal transduction histidine kinase